jgi:hypothetical protein
LFAKRVQGRLGNVRHSRVAIPRRTSWKKMECFFIFFFLFFFK